MKKNIIFAGMLTLCATGVFAAPVDLSFWTAEGSGNWDVAVDNNSVLQTLNVNPSVFYSDFDGQGIALSGQIEVETTSDDDYVGFVLGYLPGDLAAASPDYILIDWKQTDQASFGCTANKGLAISRVTGSIIDNAAPQWCHNGVVQELARATTLGNVGWADNTLYNFELIFNPENIQVFVNGAKELEINGNFANGAFGFYNYSQQLVRYSAINEEPSPPFVPEIRIIQGFINFSVTNGNPPPDVHCQIPDHYGRAVFDEVNEFLYLCTPGSGWITK